MFFKPSLSNWDFRFRDNFKYEENRIYFMLINKFFHKLLEFFNFNDLLRPTLFLTFTSLWSTIWTSRDWPGFNIPELGLITNLLTDDALNYLNQENTL